MSRSRDIFAFTASSPAWRRISAAVRMTAVRRPAFRASARMIPHTAAVMPMAAAADVHVTKSYVRPMNTSAETAAHTPSGSQLRHARGRTPSRASSHPAADASRKLKRKE